jgi:hypothetical protein
MYAIEGVRKSHLSHTEIAEAQRTNEEGQKIRKSEDGEGRYLLNFSPS